MERSEGVTIRNVAGFELENTKVFDSTIEDHRAMSLAVVGYYA